MENTPTSLLPVSPSVHYWASRESLLWQQKAGEKTTLCSNSGIHKNKDRCGSKLISEKCIWKLIGVKAVLGYHTTLKE